MRGSFIFGFLSPSNNVLIKLGATGSYAIERGYWWTTITAVYLHGGLLHIAFNTIAIRNLGPYIEEFYGVSRSFVIFSVAGIAGYVVSNAFGVPFTVGASGSLYGFLGALVYYGKKRGGVFGDAIYKQAGQWAIVWFIIGFLMPGINNLAHGGGFVGGYVASWLLGFSEIKRENRTHQIVALAFLVLTVLAFVLSIINPPYLKLR
jgi:rhomboid protease GluP